MPLRSFLFLQGACTPFFARLADRLMLNGHRVYKVNFNGGDVAYWCGRPAWSFRGDLNCLSVFLEEKLGSCDATDIVLFGDRRPVHRPAILMAKKLGIRIHVFEEGYFRPYWVTLERNGVNGNSPLPRDPDWYWEVGANLPEYGDGERFDSPFWVRALHDVLYHAASAMNPVLFPGYSTHAPYIAPIEYAGYVGRFVKLLFHHQERDRKTLDGLIRDAIPFFFLPLQLNSDAQIRDHSSFDGMNSVMEFVMESFTRHAPGDARLVIKNHPLDIGLVNYLEVIRRLERRFDLSGRVHYLETGNLDPILYNTRGVVTVNSTVGTLALQRRCPTITLSNSIYNLRGLTFQGTLDGFWQNAERPDPELFRRFRNTVIRTTQVNGGFYSREGISMAVHNSVRALQADRSRMEELF